MLIEVARSWSALGGPWALLGTSQWRTPVQLASAAVGGVWLVSYLVVAANVAVAVVLVAARRRVRLVAVGALAVAVGVGPLAFLLLHAPVGSRTVPIAVVQAGVIHGPQQRLAAEITSTEALPNGRFGLVIWGESSVGMDLASNKQVARRLEAASTAVGADLLVNVDAATPSGVISKTSVLLDATGVLASYQKMRLVPFGEYIPMRSVLGWLSSLTPAAAVNRVHGHHLVVMQADGAAFAPLICFESAFPDMSRNAARAGARFLVFQSATTTFQGTWEPDQQASLAAVRAVETGRPAISATLAGTTAAFDAQGRRLLWHPQSTGTSVIPLRLAERATPFDRFGDWVVVASLAFILIAIGFACATSRPRSSLIHPRFFHIPS